MDTERVPHLGADELTDKLLQKRRTPFYIFTITATPSAMHRGCALRPLSLLHRRLCSSTTLPLPPLPAVPEGTRPPLTLCLDLDECLVHCTVSEGSDSSFMESSGPEASRALAAQAALHQQRSRRRLTLQPDAEIELPYLETPVHLHKRPLLDDFLHEAAKLCELVVFSSAADAYARAVLAELDPTRTLFAGLLARAHCTRMDGTLVKDLSTLGRPLERTVLIDDNVGSFLLQPDNAIPILPFHGKPDDRELSHMLPLLRRLHGASDVRELLRAEFGLAENLLQGVRGLRKTAQGSG